jgi:hypothetical protein
MMLLLAVVGAFLFIHGYQEHGASGFVFGPGGVIGAAVFSFRKASATIAVDSTTVTQMAFLPATTRAIRLVEMTGSGTGNGTGGNEFWITNAAWVTGTNGALTSIAAFPDNPISTAASGFTSGTTFATSVPSPANNNGGISFGVNSNGGTYRWLAKTNFEMWAMQASANYTALLLKCVSTNGVAGVALSCKVEEL